MTCWTLLFLGTSIYVISVRPFKSKKANLVVLVQEMAILLSCLPIFIIKFNYWRSKMAMLVIFIITGAMLVTACIEGAALVSEILVRICRNSKQVAPSNQ